MRAAASVRSRMLIVAACVAIGIGCNTLLDNRPGRLDGGASSEVEDDDGGTSSEPSAASPEPPQSTSDDDASPPIADAASQDTAAPATGCGACTLANALATCDHDACAILACVPGFGDCDLDPDNGCETSLEVVTSCGACGRSCRAGRHARASCVAGACMAVCDPGFGDCDDDPGNGCERNLQKDPHDCGACGVVCLFGHCEDGSCTN